MPQSVLNYNYSGIFHIRSAAFQGICGAADYLIAELHDAVDQDIAAAVGEEGAENEEVAVGSAGQRQQTPEKES